jgi:hypothetical protein
MGVMVGVVVSFFGGLIQTARSSSSAAANGLLIGRWANAAKRSEQEDCHQVTSINKPEGSCQRQMKQDATLIRARLKTPRAAAIAGILFSVLLITGPLTVPAFGPGRSAGDGGVA